MKKFWISALSVVFAAGLAWAASVYTQLPMTGRGAKPATAEWYPASVDWGYVEMGTATTRTVRLKNSGKATLVGVIAPALGCSPAYAITSGGGAYSLAPGASKNVDITFSPTDSTAVYTCSIQCTP